MGKRALADSDSEDMDDDVSDEEEEGENNKSVVTDNENHSYSSKESDRISDSVTDAKHEVIFLDGVSSQSGSEEEKEMGAEETGISDESTGDHAEDTSVGQPDLGVSEVKTTQEVEIYTHEEEVYKNSDSSDVVERESQPSAASGSGKEEASSAKVNGNSTSKPSIQDEVVTTNVEAPTTEMPLNLEDFNSASELEVLGLERLKTELQARGLKCGGTLQERAARLFLLKTTPLEKLPKKLLAKK